MRWLTALVALVCMATSAAAATLAAGPTDLAAVLTRAQPGDVVQLAGGDYPALIASPVKAAPGITVEPAPGAEPRFPVGVKLTNCAGLTFRGPITFGRYTGVTSCERVTFDGVKVAGNPAKFAAPADMGIEVKTSRDVTIRNSAFRYLQWAVQAADNTGLLIEGNDVGFIRYDGLRGMSGSTGVTIRRNKIHSFYNANDAHRDGIQFWPGARGSRDILIEENELFPGETGGRFQHVFIGPDGGGGYDNLIVRRNSSFGPANHAFMVAGARSGELSQNFHQAAPGFGAWITLNRVAGQPLNWGNVGTGVPTSDDPARPNVKIVAAGSLTDFTALEAWRAIMAPPPKPPTIEDRLTALEAAVKALQASR